MALKRLVLSSFVVIIVLLIMAVEGNNLFLQFFMLVTTSLSVKGYNFNPKICSMKIVILE